MQARLTLEAHGDVAEAMSLYKTRAQHIVPRFLEAYRGLLARLEDNPNQFPRIHSRATVRRADFTEFSYGLFYRIGPDEVEVFACLHGKRRPRHWPRQPRRSSKP